MSVTTEQVRKTLARRYRAEKRFKAYGICAISIGLLALLLLFTDIIGKGYRAFYEYSVALQITFDPESLEIDDPRDLEQLQYGNYEAVVREALKARFPGVEGREDRRALRASRTTAS